jgi:chromosome segregation ATPase
MQKNLGNNYSTNPSPSNTKLFEDAAKKLQKIEIDRKNAEKYFKDKEMAENKMKLLESNLKKKVKLEKRATLGLEEKTLEKMQILLKSLSNVDLNLINKIEVSEKSSKEVQTENEDTQILKDKLSTLEKENEKNLFKKKEYKKQIELLKSEMENLKNFNEKISKENKLLQHNLEEMTNLKNELENRSKEYQMRIDQLNETLQKSQRSLVDYEELKKMMEEKLMNEKESVELEEQRKESLIKKGHLNIFIYYDMIDQVTKFLPASDVINLKRTNRSIYQNVEKNLNCMNQFYKSVIFSYKKKLHELSSLDIKKEYIVNDMEIERLIKE